MGTYTLKKKKIPGDVSAAGWREPQCENHHFAKLQTITSIFPLCLNIWNPQPSESPAPFWEEYIKVYFKVPEIQSKKFGAHGFLAIGWANIDI